MTTDASFLLSLSLPASLKTWRICVYIVIINKREKNKLKYGLNYPLQRENVFHDPGVGFSQGGAQWGQGVGCGRPSWWLVQVSKRGLQAKEGSKWKQEDLRRRKRRMRRLSGPLRSTWSAGECRRMRNWEAGDLRLAEDGMRCLLQLSSQARCVTVVMVEWGKLKVKVSWIEDVKKPLSQGIGCITHSFEYWKHSVEGFWEKMSQLPMFLMNKKEQSWQWDRLPGTRRGRALVMSFEWWKNFTGRLWLINDLGWKEERRDGKAFFQLSSMVLRPWKRSI